MGYNAVLPGAWILHKWRVPRIDCFDPLWINQCCSNSSGKKCTQALRDSLTKIELFWRTKKLKGTFCLCAFSFKVFELLAITRPSLNSYSLTIKSLKYLEFSANIKKCWLNDRAALNAYPQYVRYVVCMHPVLRIRDVYPGSEFFPSRTCIKEFKYFDTKIVSKLSEILSGLSIPDPYPQHFMHL